jgi:hypothetical protein
MVGSFAGTMVANTFQSKYDALLQLGRYLRDFSLPGSGPVDARLAQLVKEQYVFHPWHTETTVLEEMSHWAERLSESSLQTFLHSYSNYTFGAGTVAVLPLQDVPLAGFYEMICVWLAGKSLVCCGEHQELMQYLGLKLCEFDSSGQESLQWTNFLPKDASEYIVYLHGGENHTLKQYFSRRKSLMIEKRCSVAVIHSNDTAETLTSLGYDIFHTFGQSPFCVRKLFVPEGFRLESFFEAIEPFAHVYQHNRYANNYDYHKSVLLMDRKPFLDNGFLVVREVECLPVPIGCLYYQMYKNTEEVNALLKKDEEQIHQVISSKVLERRTVLPGQAHRFTLSEYLPEVNMWEFLKKDQA